MARHILYFEEIDKSSLPDVGGKGANLGELTKAGFAVPGGFCVTTSAYREFLNSSAEIHGLLDRLDELTIDDLDKVRELGKLIRDHLLSLPIADNMRSNILSAFEKIGPDKAYAVRSSATAEDLPTASFAGQLESYLNVKSAQALIESVIKCWASLFTERAIIYRIKNRFAHQDVAVSVVVQEMVFPEVSGIMFTADPVSGNRRVISIDASFGLGEALVSGIVTADLFQVRSNRIVNKQIAEKRVGIYSLADGGVVKKELSSEQQQRQSLSDNDILRLAELGSRIERHYDSPQDIEWGLSGDTLYILQSRPITSLYPIPEPEIEDDGLRVFFSFSHLQNMTDAMKPLALSMMRTVMPLGKKGRVEEETSLLFPAGGRLYVDPTRILRTRIGSRFVPAILDNLDKLTSDTISIVIKREEFVKNMKPSAKAIRALMRNLPPVLFNILLNIWVRDPSDSLRIVNSYIDNKAREVENRLSALSGTQRVMYIRSSAGMLLIDAFRNVIPYLAAGIGSQRIIGHLLKKWLGDSRDQQYLNKSLRGNATTEMGLELGDLADLARGNSALIAYLKNAGDDTFFAGLRDIEGGAAFTEGFMTFMHRYGMRCPGEIDLTRPRWIEAPAQLTPILLSDIESLRQGEHRQRFEEGEEQAAETARNIVSRLKLQRGSFYKTRIMRRLIYAFRHLMVLREHLKYLLVRVFLFYKRALLEEARDLVNSGVLKQEKDIFYLSLAEIQDILEGCFDGDIYASINRRKADFERYKSLKSPRVMTSEGEIIKPNHNNSNAPAGALIGLGVSSGIVEGRARVASTPKEANLEPGDILVAPYTDPAWTPLFISARGLVTEAGGLMTHGAVIAREYGIPAVAGVEEATTRITDGQRIRVNGDQGFIELL